MLLRKKLANVAGISIKDDVLAKLMVLEYTNVKRFQDLNNWQAIEDGLPSALRKLEEEALGIENAVAISPEDKLGEWQTPTIKKWLQMQPSLREIDLRDYFWLFRDRTTSSLIGVSLTSPLVRRLFESLVAGNDGERHMATREAENLLDSEREELLGLLKQKVERHPDEIGGFEALSMLAEKRIVGAGRTMLDGVQNVQPSRLPPGVAYKISTLGAQDEILKSETQTWLQNLDEKTPVGKAAKKALRS
jgi:hypothetical protein